VTYDPLRMWSHGTQGHGEYLPLSTDQLPGQYNQSVAPGLDVTPGSVDCQPWEPLMTRHRLAALLQLEVNDHPAVALSNS